MMLLHIAVSIYQIIISVLNLYFSIGKLQINFMTLQEISECGVKFSLYANESIGEEECANYNFQSQRNIKAYTEKVICFISNSNQYQVIIKNLLNFLTFMYQYFFSSFTYVLLYFILEQYLYTSSIYIYGMLWY